jgi:hypothetical protein
MPLLDALVAREIGERARDAPQRLHRARGEVAADVRALDEAALRAILAVDTGPYPALLEEDEIAGLMQRRDYALRYLDDLIARYGERDVLVFP